MADDKDLVESARRIAEQLYANHKGELSGRLMIVHANCCAEMGRELANGLDVDALMIGGYLHDVGRTVSDDENHTVEGAKIVERFFKEHNVDNGRLKDVVIDCTLNHGSKAKPTTKEGKLMQFIDKAALINVKIMQVLLEDFAKTATSEEARANAKQKLEGWFKKLGENQKRVAQSHKECIAFIENY